MELPKLSDIPKPPSEATFRLDKIEKISIPHPFMITPGHVAYAADHHGGMLTTEAIKESKVRCGWTTREPGYNYSNVRCNLSVDEHETQITLFIRVPQNHDLNAVEGLHAYLLSIKDK